MPKKSGSRSEDRTDSKKKAKNSLVENINRRKRAGKSRSKANSTISDKAYSDMQKGWPEKNQQAKR